MQEKHTTPVESNICNQNDTRKQLVYSLLQNSHLANAIPPSR